MKKTRRIVGLSAPLAVAVMLSLGGVASAQNAEADEDIDLGANTFVQNCLRCHGGILTGNDLQNTSLSSMESLTATVRRMQQFTPPLSEEQTAALVELLKDKEVRFRLEDAQLELGDDAAANAVAPPAPGQAAAAPADPAAALFIKNCAICHTIGPGFTTGGDLTRTLGQPEAVVKANVTRMQVRTGPMTTDQINQLTALLKDSKRNDRLASAGYKAPAAPTPTPAASASTTGGAEKRWIRPITGGHVPEETHGVPMDVLLMSLGMAAVAAAAAYFMAGRDKA